MSERLEITGARPCWGREALFGARLTSISTFTEKAGCHVRRAGPRLDREVSSRPAGTPASLLLSAILFAGGPTPRPRCGCSSRESGVSSSRRAASVPAPGFRAAARSAAILACEVNGGAESLCLAASTCAAVLRRRPCVSAWRALRRGGRARGAGWSAAARTFLEARRRAAPRPHRPAGAAAASVRDDPTHGHLVESLSGGARSRRRSASKNGEGSTPGAALRYGRAPARSSRTPIMQLTYSRTSGSLSISFLELSDHRMKDDLLRSDLHPLPVPSSHASKSACIPGATRPGAQRRLASDCTRRVVIWGTLPTCASSQREPAGWLITLPGSESPAPAGNRGSRLVQPTATTPTFRDGPNPRGVTYLRPGSTTEHPVALFLALEGLADQPDQRWPTNTYLEPVDAKASSTPVVAGHR